MAKNILNITSSNFDQHVAKSPVPVLVDFWADWCGPCKGLSPILDELATQYADKVRIGKVDVNEEAALAAQFNVHSLPTLLLFKQGEIVEQIVGLKSPQFYKSRLDSATS